MTCPKCNSEKVSDFWSDYHRIIVYYECKSCGHTWRVDRFDEWIKMSRKEKK